jgi:hypothetical protein
MKILIKYLKYIVACMILSVTFACSNDFLDDVPVGYLTTPYGGYCEIDVSPEWGEVEYPLYCMEAANASFSISDIPQWLDISPTSGQFTNGVTFVTCRASVNSKFDKCGLYNVMITVTIDGVGKYCVPVYYINEGTPELVAAESLKVTYSQYYQEQYLDISNNGNGILMFSIKECPEWVIIRADASSMLMPYSTTSLFVTFNAEYNVTDEMIAKGQLKGNIVIASNDRKHNEWVVEVVCNFAASAGNIMPIFGMVSDAWLDKSTDLLYIATQQPNRISVYNTKTKSTDHAITLPYAPTCFKMSGDKSKIAVGHEGKISFVDMSNNEIEKTVEVETTVFDIEWGADNWCCYTPGYTFQGFCGLKWINAITDERYEAPNDYEIRGGAIIKKIPNHDYMIVTHLSLSPSGIYVYDSQTREYVKYFHETLVDNYRISDPFWFSENGDYLFDSNGNVYRTSLLINNTEVSPVSRLKLNERTISSLDHNQATNTLWALYQSSVYETNYGKIWQLETNDYMLVQTLYYTESYPTVIDGFYGEYPVEGRYIFSNSAGDEIFVIKNIREENLNAWSMEYISL